MMLELFAGNPLARTMANLGMRFMGRRRVQELDAMDVAAVQRQTLLKLIRKAAATNFGRDHQFANITSVEAYQQAVPVRTYEDFWNNYWKDHYPRLEGTTWPDVIPYFALSSGTTSGATKYIPISKEMLASNRRAALTTEALFRVGQPNANLVQGKFFFLGGNTNLRQESNGSKSGDLSAISALEVASYTKPYTFPPRELSNIANWEEKVQRLAEASAKLPITAVSGVPSWMLFLFNAVKKVTGKKYIHEAWPKLQLIIHGGTKFDPYREVFQQEVGPKCSFIEVYPCSEGFIATEDPRYKLLRVVPDHGIFFEFIPMSEFQDGKLKSDRPVRHTLATLETNQEYAVALTTCAGLWSYLVGDTVSFVQKSPPLLRFTGRTKYFLSAFGEHLISEELEKAIAAASEQLGTYTAEFHVGPIFPSEPDRPGHHRYLVEFGGPVPDLQRFATIVDDTLNKLNEDYEAHRKNDLTMLKPEMITVKPGGFLRWMLAHGKTPPQHKVPRMDNSGTQTAAMYTWLRDHGELA